MDYRNKQSFDVVKLPFQLNAEDRGLRECCVPFKVFADLNSNDSYKNDKTIAFLSTPDSATFEMKKNGVIIPNLGEVLNAPNDNNLKGFIYDWKDILSAHGIGFYTVNINYTISGITGAIQWGGYELNQYSYTRVKNSVRVSTIFNDYSMRYDCDFTNSNAADTIRFKGYFGDRKPNTEINNLISSNRVVEKTKRENLNKYDLKTDPVNYCTSTKLIDLHLLHGNKFFISDHNQSNHSYQYLDAPFSLEETPEMEYYQGNRLTKISVIFGDRTKNQKSYYNG